MAVWGVPGGLAVLDTTVPSSPAAVGQCVSLTTSMANRVTLFGRFALVPLELAAWSGVAVYDLTDPTAPRQLGTARLGFQFRDRKVYCCAVTTSTESPATSTSPADGSGGGAPRALLHLFEAKASRILTYALHLPPSAA